MSLQQFLEVLAESNDLVQVPDVADPHFEIASWVRSTCDNEGPALLFETPKYWKGRMVAGGVYATKDRIKRILDPNYRSTYCGASDLLAVQKYWVAADVNQGDSLGDHCAVVMPEDGPPCQEVVWDYVDLNELPICIHNEFDKGPFVTAGVNIVRWLNGETHGLGIHRMYQIDKDHLSCLAPPNRRVGLPHYRDSEQAQEGVKMAVAIGAPPEVVLASQAKVNSRTEKYIIAANLQREPIKLARCLTSDLLVPAESEIILECTTVPNSEFDDTPFAEYPGTYSFRSNAFIVRVDKITMRRDAVYQTILTGMVPQEDSNLCAIPYAAEVYKIAQNFVEEVTDIAAFIGNNVFDTIICIKKNSNSEVENLMHQLLGNKYLKSVTIMDHDLKANQDDWRFAFNTRYQPNRDTIITNLALGASLDPSSPLFQSTSKVAFDFTVPHGPTKEDTDNNWRRHRVARTHPGYVHTVDGIK
jgi:2,5-furandicarboxylate decarboxylase 1